MDGSTRQRSDLMEEDPSRYVPSLTRP